MELEFTPEQDELRDGVRALLEQECPMSAVRALVEKRWTGSDAQPDALWAHMVELGWPALTVPEAAGGLGMGAVELAVVAEELGRVVGPGPFLPTVSQFVPAIREAGSAEQQIGRAPRLNSSHSSISYAVFCLKKKKKKTQRKTKYNVRIQH